MLVAVNYAPNQNQCYVRLPFTDLVRSQRTLLNQMEEVVYERAGGDLLFRGLYLDTPRGKRRFLQCSPENPDVHETVSRLSNRICPSESRTMADEKSVSAIELSLTEGGVSSRILDRFIRLHPPDRRSYLRLALILGLATWVPLTVLCALEGAAFPGSVAEPFFEDITPHVRFLFALPVLIIADLLVGPNIVRVGSRFVSSGIVPDGCLAGFDAIAKSAIKFRESRKAELTVLAIAYATSIYNVHRELGTGVSSWLLADAGSAFNLTAAGWWYILLSVPIYQFFLFRWAVRLGNWAVFLFRVSRLDLELVPTHPDGAAGLGFVGQVLAPTSVIILAASSVLCSSIGTQVIYRGAKIQEFILAFALFVVVAVITFLAPFAVFLPKLIATRRKGLLEYGTLATRYAQLFQRKWVGHRELAGAELLGTDDIQSLADIANSVDRVENMKLFPIELADLRALLIAALLPAIPLVLTQISLRELWGIISKVLF